MKALVLLAPLPGLASQPEVIRHAQAERDNGNAYHHEPSSALFFPKLLGFFGGTLGQLGGGLG